MKHIITLLTLSLFLVHFSFAQQKIGVVDMDATIEGWNKAVRLDQMLTQKSKSLKTMVETWLNKLQEKYDEYDKKSGTPTQQNTLANDILDGQEEILIFERILVDSIPLFRRNVLQLIEAKIQETVDAVAIANNYDLIIAKNNILFYRGEEIDELIVTTSALDLQDIQAEVEALNIKLTAWIETYTNRIEEY
jgi:Skp family chaperone for outer membrane proteins